MPRLPFTFTSQLFLFCIRSCKAPALIRSLIICVKEVVINPLQKSPALLLPCCVFLPVDISEIQVLHKDHGLQTGDFVQLSEEVFSYFLLIRWSVADTHHITCNGLPINPHPTLSGWSCVLQAVPNPWRGFHGHKKNPQIPVVECAGSIHSSTSLLSSPERLRRIPNLQFTKKALLKWRRQRF